MKIEDFEKDFLEKRNKEILLKYINDIIELTNDFFSQINVNDFGLKLSLRLETFVANPEKSSDYILCGYILADNLSIMRKLEPKDLKFDYNVYLKNNIKMPSFFVIDKYTKELSKKHFLGDELYNHYIKAKMKNKKEVITNKPKV